MIKRFLVNGSEEKLSKSVLADEISDGLLPEATSEDEGKVVSVDATGGYVLSTIESELPAATSEDEGKVVTVSQDGSYELAEAGGGAFIVHVDDETNTLDKTWAEINTAITTQPVILVFDHGDAILHNRKACYIVQTSRVVDRMNIYYVYAIEYEFGVSDVSITKRQYQTTNKNGYPIGG